MKNLRNSGLLVGFAVLFAGHCFAQTNTGSDCVVTGKFQTNDVLEKRGDGLPFADMNLIFSNKSINKSTKSDQNGAYSVTLPAGIYQVSVDPMYYSIFYRRAPFRCQGSVVVNIYPLMRQISSGITSTGPLNHLIETLGEAWTGSDKLSIVIAYLMKKKEKNLTRYQGNVYLTFDKYCVFAGEVITDEKTKTLTAMGFAWIEDGTQRTKVEKVTLNFYKKGDPPVISLTSENDKHN